MSIIRIVMTLTCIQFAECKTMLRNESKSSPAVQISTEFVRLQRNYTVEKTSTLKSLSFDSKSFHNSTRKIVEIKTIPKEIAKKNYTERYFTTDGIHKANGTKKDRNISHNKAIRHNLKNHPEVPLKEKTSLSNQSKSLPDENDTSKNILIFLIASIFIVILIVGLTMYIRHSYVTILLNQDHDHSKDEKKLRYSEVATEDQPINVTNNTWKKTMLSKIAIFSCKSNSANNLATPRNELDIQIPSTPPTRTISTESNNSTGTGSGIESSQELDEGDVAIEKPTKSTTEPRKTNCQKKTCGTTNKGYDESLVTSEKMCPKCNHYRDPEMIVKRINEVERKGSRIFIPIRLPVTFGSGKIKSFGFPKLGNPSNTNPNQKNSQREPCSSGIQPNRTKLNSSSPKKNEKRCRISWGSTTGKSKSIDCASSSTSSSQQKTNRCLGSSSSSTCKSKANSDCSFANTSRQSEDRKCASGSTSKSTDCTSSVCSERRENEQSGSSTGKSKPTEDTLSSTCWAYNQQQENSQCHSSAEKSKTSDDYSTIDTESTCQSQKSVEQNSCRSTKTTSSTCTSKSEGSSSKALSSSDKIYSTSPSMSTRVMNSEYNTSLATSSQSQEVCQSSTSANGSAQVSDKMDETSRECSCDASEMKIYENYSDEEDCQSVRENNTNFSASCSTKASNSTRTSSITKYTVSSHRSESDQPLSLEDHKSESNSNDSPINCEESVAKECNGSTSPEKSLEKSNQQSKNTKLTQMTIDSPLRSSTPYKAPVKIKVLSTDPNYDPSTLQVKQQLKMLLQDSSTEQPCQSENKLQPGQVIYADLCFVPRDAIKCTTSNISCKSAICKDVEMAIPSCSKSTQKQANITSESESDAGYGPSQNESCESEDTNGHCDMKNQTTCDEIDECYKQCVSKICHDEYPRSSFTRRFSSRFSRRGNADETMRSSISSDSRGSFIHSLNQRLKGTYLYQTKGSSNRSRFNSSSRCTPVIEYTVDDDCDVYEPIEEHLESGNQSSRSSMNKLLPRIRSYMTKRKKCNISGAEQVYTEPSVDEGMTELCENCLKHIPKDISKTIRSRQSTYSDVDKFKQGGTIHLNDLIEVYPNLYPKLPSPIREALSKGFDDYSVAQYGNLCDNYEPVRESRWSELSSSFENINCIN